MNAADPPAAPRGAPLRIAVVRQKYNPFGGAERFIERALAALSATDTVELTIIARRWTERPGVRFLRCDPPARTSLARDKSFAGAVTALLADPQHRFDIVQSHERIPGLMLYRAGDGVHATWLEQRARALPAWRRLVIAANPYHRYMLATERAMFTHAALERAICNSAMVRDDIAARFGVPAGKLTVIHNGVDLERHHPRNRERRGEMRAALGIDADAPLFLYAGSGFERKGVAPLLRAFARVPATAHLLLAGEDKHLARYRASAAAQGIAGRVHFLGGRDDLPALYGAADAFVLPTLYDPMPNVAIEALACGLPVVTSNQCGAREFIREGENGFLVDALDEAALAAALNRLAEPGRAAAMGAAARASVVHLAPEAMAGQLLALYRALRPDR
jgi:UDP-glucose:(heptosyl)LPS alpha-1,3-glucosyltransferase